MNEATSRASASIDEEHLILAEKGWRPLNATSLVPAHSKATLLTEELLRRHATFDIFHPCLNSRSEQLKALALSRYDETGAFPLKSDIASTIAAIAAEMQTNGGDWNSFWRDVILLLPNGQKTLAQYEVLIGADGKLHCVGSDSRVFFMPRQGTQDDGDVGAEGTATEIPPSLQTSVAFLSDQVQLYDPNKPTVQTAVRAYLGGGLVSQFRVETIFTGVLQELAPSLPVLVEGTHSELCRDIMRWALRLIGNIVARGRGADVTLRLLRMIPVPCQGGWFPMGEASFGEGWAGTIGSTLKSYLDCLKSPAAEEARKRLLLPPVNSVWGDIGISEQQLLVAGGVFDGLRLHQVRSDTWVSHFQASSSDFSLPISTPATFTNEQWSTYKTLVQSETRPHFTSSQLYVVGVLMTFPGFDEAHSMLDETRLSLSELILQSLPHWGQGLAPLEIAKKGGLTDRLQVTSPLKFFLQSTPWFGIRDAKGVTWARLLDRWHVPADAIGSRARHFVHLKALPATVARRLDTQDALANVLHSLGMPHFDLYTETASPKLLEALTASIGDDDAPDSNVLFGQIRDAWHRFRPPPSQPALKQLVVRRSDKRLEVMTPTNDAPMYLPDSGAYVTELEQFNIPVLTIYQNDAKDLKEWFAAAYGPRVQLTSRLELVPHVNGIVWSGVSAAPLADSELGWLIRPLLAMVAFHGQFRGIHSVAFQGRANLLREACIDWVPNLSVVIMRGEARVISTEVPAFWDIKRKTIVASELCRCQPGELSTALSQALERDDLELPIRYVLRSLESVEAEPEDVRSFLAPLRISAEQVQQVIEHLRGDVGHMGRLIHILATVLAPEADTSALLDAKTEDELRVMLSTLDIADLDVKQTLHAVRESHDMFDFGRSMSRDLGEAVALSRWNQTLLRLEQPLLTNRNWRTQLLAGLEEASGLVKRLLANLVRQDNSNSFLKLWSAYDGLSRTIDLSLTHWEVDFQAAMSVVANLIQSWKCGDILVNAVHESKSAQQLRERLLALGVPLDIDPDECARKNHQLVDSVASFIEKLRLAWWLKAAAGGPHAEWQGDVGKYRSVAAERLSNDAYTRIWSETEVFALLRSSGQHVGLTDFWSAMLSSSDLASLQSALQLSADELAGAESQLAGLKADLTRMRNIIDVCGEDFDSSEDNLDQLWDFLKNRIPDESLTKSEPLDLGKPAALTTFKAAGGKVRPDVPRQASKMPHRQSKSVDELVGLAGEIFVYRMLQKKYGNDVVTPSSWVSENSTHAFPYNQADDGKGCDFAFAVKGKLLRVEVKSSAGDDEAFKLGSSEIRLAMDLGTRGKRRREVFVLVQVKHALSATPTAVVLPNPYDPKFAGMFIIEEADARVRYRTKR